MNSIADAFKIVHRSMSLSVYVLLLPPFVVVCLTAGLFQYWARGLHKEDHPFIQITNMWRNMSAQFSGNG